MKKIKKKFIYLGIVQIISAICFIIAEIIIEANPSYYLTSKLHFISGLSFSVFFIPDHFLLAFYGIGNLLGAFLSFQRYNSTSYLGMFLGTILILWIIFLFVTIGITSFLQLLFLIVGVSEVVMGYSIFIKVRKQNQQMRYHS